MYLLVCILISLSLFSVVSCQDYPYREGFSVCTDGCVANYEEFDRSACASRWFYDCMHRCLCEFRPDYYYLSVHNGH